MQFVQWLKCCRCGFSFVEACEYSFKIGLCEWSQALVSTPSGQCYMDVVPLLRLVTKGWAVQNISSGQSMETQTKGHSDFNTGPLTLRTPHPHPNWTMRHSQREWQTLVKRTAQCTNLPGDRAKEQACCRMSPANSIMACNNNRQPASGIALCVHAHRERHCHSFLHKFANSLAHTNVL